MKVFPGRLNWRSATIRTSRGGTGSTAVAPKSLAAADTLEQGGKLRKQVGGEPMLILFRNLGWLIGLISRQQWMLVSSRHQRHARYYSVAAVQDIRGSTTGRLPALQTPAGVLDENVTPLS